MYLFLRSLRNPASRSYDCLQGCCDPPRPPASLQACLTHCGNVCKLPADEKNIIEVLADRHEKNSCTTYKRSAIYLPGAMSGS